MPTSITMAPCRIHSPFTKPGLPQATMRHSASRTTASRSCVNLCTICTEAPFSRSSSIMGRPTWLLAPTTTQRRPYGFTPVLHSRCITPKGVHGRSLGSRVTRRPRLNGWKPSTSLSARIVSSMADCSSCSCAVGSGSCTRMPSQASSSFRPRIVASSSEGEVSSGSSSRVLLMPTSWQAFCFCLMYTLLAASAPTSTTTSPGDRPPLPWLARLSSSSALMMARTSADMALPSIRRPRTPSSGRPLGP
mmetsp:Transcript_19317/g.51228  ORF Transcript_19317/g.51228 Transcript_19317/m.51228 type:complete len:248 (+) Transcript_19317:453-1196(+)